MTMQDTIVERSANLQFFSEQGIDIDRLCSAVRSQRFTMFATIESVMSRVTNAAHNGIGNAFFEVASMPFEQRQFVLDDPAFARWLDCMTIAVRRFPATLEVVRTLSQSLPDLLERAKARYRPIAETHIPGTSILVQRFDIDPVIKEATPPTYDFEQAELMASAGQSTGQPGTELFADVLGVAFHNIQECDPGLWEVLRHLIQIVGYLPDATFRSCSAVRYHGVVYLSGVEESIIELEESIVHEASHQLLYKIAEVCPITELSASLEATFELPWSGSKRDLFGYYHAYFIYLQLVKYLDNRAKTAKTRRAKVVRRRELIHRGLEIASRDLAGANGMTPFGAELFSLLNRQVNGLRES